MSPCRCHREPGRWIWSSQFCTSLLHAKQLSLHLHLFSFSLILDAKTKHFYAVYCMDSWELISCLPDQVGTRPGWDLQTIFTFFAVILLGTIALFCKHIKIPKIWPQIQQKFCGRWFHVSLALTSKTASSVRKWVVECGKLYFLKRKVTDNSL